MAAPMKHFLDSTGDLWAANALENKPGMAFTSTSSMHGGQEITLWNILTYMLHQGMMIIGAPTRLMRCIKRKVVAHPMEQVM